MPDAFDSSRDPGTALRALPLLSPPRSAWPELQDRLRRRTPAWRRRTSWAAAATLALALILPQALDRFSPSAPDIAAPEALPELAQAALRDSDAKRIGALMFESARLETLLDWSRAERVESAPNAVLAVALQGRIGDLDRMLSRPDSDPEAELPLWQERVLRLRQLAELEGAEQLLAAHGSAQEMPMLAF